MLANLIFVFMALYFRFVGFGLFGVESVARGGVVRYSIHFTSSRVVWPRSGKTSQPQG